MTEDKLFVDNPLTLTGLYGAGLYLVPELRKRKFPYTGQGTSGILNIVFYEGKSIPAGAVDVIQKIMNAVKPGQKPLPPSGYAIINAADVEEEDKLLAIIADFEPVKTIIWTDQWFSPSKEILFYRQEKLENGEFLRCHSPETVIADEDRRKECWAGVKQLFGM